MDLEGKLELIKKPPTEEIITQEELKNLLETKEHPIAYNGWEPSGLVHLGTGLICAYKMKDLIEAGIRFKVYLACWHAWINDKLEGNLELIEKAAKHFLHVWYALGVPKQKIEIIWPTEEYKKIEYWNLVLKISKHLTLARVKRTLEIMGRKEIEAKKLAYLIYTPMQVADIFHFEVDVCQLGMDQRKANMVARELAQKLGFKKPVCVHHHLLKGLAKPALWPLPSNPLERKEVIISAKMSKSKPETCIFVYDEPEIIKRKILNAFCPKETEFNPILDMIKFIVFKELEKFEIESKGKIIEFENYEEFEKAYREGKIHPLDVKNALSEVIIKILEPVRKYFEKEKEAKRTLGMLRKATITR